MKKKAIIKISSISIFTLIVASFIGGAAMLKIALKPQISTMQKSREYMCKQYPYISNWLDSVEANGYLRDTSIINNKGKKLIAKYMQANPRTNKTAVILHGYTDDAYRIIQLGYMYSHDLGYNILIPNHQYHGGSEGEIIQMGWKDRLNTLLWMDLANNIFGTSTTIDTTSNYTCNIDLNDERNSGECGGSAAQNTFETQMVIHGISMGAATTMMVSGENVGKYVKCYIEDCGYTSVWDQFKKELKEDFGLPTFPILYSANLLCNILYNWGFKEASSINQVKKCNLPMFFIHGTADKYIPTWMVYPLYQAHQGQQINYDTQAKASSSNEKDLWLVTDAAHAVSYKNNPAKYTQKVRKFTERYIY